MKNILFYKSTQVSKLILSELRILVVLFTVLIGTSTEAIAQCGTPNGGGSSGGGCTGGVVTFTMVNQGVTGPVSHRWYTTSSGGTYFTQTTATQTYPGSMVWISTYQTTLSTATTYYGSSVCNGVESSGRRAVSWSPTSPGYLTITTGGVPPYLCIGDAITLTPNGGSGYSWSSNPAGASGSGSITVTPSVNTTYILSGYESVCGNYTSTSITINVSPKVGQVSISSGPNSFCQGAYTSSTYTASATDASSYSWGFSPPEAGSISSSGVVTWNSSFIGTATVSVTAFSQSNCNYTTQTSQNVSINAVPGTPTVSNVSAAFGSTVTLTASGASPANAYKWFDSQGSQTSNIVNTQSLSSPSTTYTVGGYNTSSLCETPGGQRASQTLTLYLNAPPAPTISTNTCGPKTVTLPSPPSGVTYYWQGHNASGESTAEPVNPSYTVGASGTYNIRAKVNSMNLWSSAVAFSVTVIDPLAPAVPTISANACGPKTLTRATPSDGSTWYWQGTNASGTDMSNSATTYPVGVSGTYYIRAYLSTCWSPATAVAVTVVDPLTPSVPTVSSNTCGVRTLTRGTPSDGSNWYWQGTNVSGTDLSNLATTYDVTATGTTTQYIRAFKGGCWSTNSASVTVTVTNPAAPSTPSVSTTSCGPKTLTRVTPSDGTTWYWQGTNASGQDQSIVAAASTYQASIHGTQSYYIRAYLNGCWSAATSVSVTVNNPMPDMPIISANTCGPKTLTKGIPPVGVGWYWQGTNATGQDISSSAAIGSIYTVEGSGTYYLGGFDGGSCWLYRTIVVEVEPVDITVNSYDPVNTLVQATRSITLGPNFSMTPGGTFNAKIMFSPECNDYVNWTENIVYNESATPIGSSKSYFDGLGKSLLSESKDHLANKIFASQPLYDSYGMPAASTMAAPIIETEFLYKRNFVRNVNNLPYGSNDFDLRTSGAGEINNPKPVGEQPGTLGWYYSTSNNLEPLTPVTDFPYARGYTPEGPNPTTSKSAGPGDAFRMGAGHESLSEKQLIGAGDLTHYLSLRSHFVSSSLPVTGYKIISTDADGKKVVSFTDADGRGLASATLTGSTFDNWSYSYYNDLGQLVASVAPNGVNTGSSAYPSFVTLYKYDQLGRLIETTSTDEGTSRFVYSTDGKIRFSENQVQRDATPKRFSYTNYDYMGRLLESGEYSSSSGGYIFEPHTTATPASNSVLNLVDQVGQSAGVTRKIGGQQGYISDYTFIEYDVQAVDFPEVSPVFQENLDGQVAKTENANSITWYSYDEFGQVVKTWQKIININIANPAVIKTIDYTYDYFGNVTEVAYQKNTAADRFYHHYTYDLNNRLTEVRTSKDGVNKTLQATYLYYLHGPLKKVILANNLQGIDYTYTIDGSLKGINHADPAKDPGADGTDKFGETLQYFDGDYQGAGYSAGTQTLTGYNNQYSGLLKATSWNSPADNNTKRTYAYEYDSRNQLTNAVWGDMNGSAGSYTFGPALLQRHREAASSYDKNGNIQGMTRIGKNGNTLANYAYVYESNTNKLDKVNHNAAQLVDYTYNSIGQMVKQDEGASKTFNITYNAYGLVKEVRNNSNILVQSYFYDDRGNLLQRVGHNTSGVPQKYTTYISDVAGNILAIYDQSGTTTLATQPLEVPVYGAGRIAVHKPAANAYFYEINDHLGNVRAVIGVPSATTYPASFETGFAGSGQNDFTNYISSTYDLVDHTDAGTTYQQIHLLNGGASGRVGLAKSFSVSPGDKVKIDAYGKFRNLTGNGNSTSFITALASTFGVSSSSTGDQLNLYNGLNSYAGSVPAGDHQGDNDLAPKAFVTILLFDKNYNLLDAAWDQIDASAEQVSGSVKTPPLHDLLTKEVTVTEQGFAYVFLSNEHPYYVDIYFDDVAVTHTQSPIVAGSDYYPYGLPMDGREITDEPYRFGYQGQFSEKDLTTGWNEFELRMYDARFGRWLSPDPYGQFVSPYLAMGNNPTSNVDPDGGTTGPVIKPIGAFKYAKAIEAAAEASSFGILLKEIVITPTVIGSLAEDAAWLAKDFAHFMTSSRILNETEKGFLGATTLAAGLTQGSTGLSTYEPDPFATKLGFGISLMLPNPGKFSPGAAPQLVTPNGLTLLPNALPSLVNAQKVHNILSTGFDLSGALGGIWKNAKWFLNWLKNNHSLSRISKPLNAIEAQQIIDNAKNLGLPIESNLKGLQGLEVTGQWGGVPHFKVGNVHVPIEPGLENVLKF